MRITIDKGDHRPGAWTRLKMRAMIGCCGTRTFRVRFIEGYDQTDPAHPGYHPVSKLWGRGFLSARTHSVRFGYQRKPNTGCLMIVRLKEHDDDLDFDDPNHTFDSEDMEPVRNGAWSVPMTISGVGFPCVSYFGGRYPAPCRITYDLERV